MKNYGADRRARQFMMRKAYEALERNFPGIHDDLLRLAKRNGNGEFVFTEDFWRAYPANGTMAGNEAIQEIDAVGKYTADLINALNESHILEENGLNSILRQEDIR